MPGYNTGPGQDNYGGMDGFGNPTGGNNNGTGVSPDPQPSAEDVYGISPNLGIAAETQKDRFSRDNNNSLQSGLQSLADVYSKYSPTALAMQALGFVRDAVEDFFGYEGGPAAAPTIGNPNNPDGGGGPLPSLTTLPMQALDPNQDFIDNLTDPYQIRIAEMMEGQDYTPAEIREYIEATSSDVGLV